LPAQLTPEVPDDLGRLPAAAPCPRYRVAEAQQQQPIDDLPPRARTLGQPSRAAPRGFLVTADPGVHRLGEQLVGPQLTRRLGAMHPPLTKQVTERIAAPWPLLPLPLPAPLLLGAPPLPIGLAHSAHSSPDGFLMPPANQTSIGHLRYPRTCG
jgi:hypothetical protein